MRKTRNIKNRFIVAGLFFLHGFLLSAQQMTLRASKDTISFYETVVLTLSGEATDIVGFAEIPQIDGMVVIAKSENFSMNGGNGKIKINQTFTLSPYKAGSFTVGPAWIRSGSNRIFSNKINIVVTASDKISLSNDVFLRCEPDKKKAVVGEQITLSITLYTRYDPSFSEDQDRPLAKTFNGFWYHEGVSDIHNDTGVIINGLPYRGLTVYKEYVFPNTTGKLKIPAYEYSCFVKQNLFPTGDPMVDDVMGIPIPVQLVSPEVSIEVVAVPEKNKPASFVGDVGVFSLSSTIDKVQAKVNEAIKLTVTISGVGNINFIQLPKINIPADVERYAPVSSDTTYITKAGLEGEKTFVITLIPKKEGEYVLPGVEFSYFDPKKKEYVTVQTSEFKLKILPGDQAQNVSVNNLPESFLDGRSYGKIIFRILGIGVPAILLILLLFYRSRKKKKELVESENTVEENIESVNETVKSKPDINSMLQVAERFIINGSTQSGIAQLYETLLTAVLFKTELGREEASINQLRYRLGIKNFSPELISETIQVLEDLAAQRYTSQESDRSKLSENLQKIRKLALELLS